MAKAINNYIGKVEFEKKLNTPQQPLIIKKAHHLIE